MDEQEKNRQAEEAAAKQAKLAEGWGAVAAECKVFVDGGTLDEVKIWKLAAKYGLPAEEVEQYLAETKKRVAEEAERFAEQLKGAKPQEAEPEVVISPEKALVAVPSRLWVPDEVKEFNSKHAVISNLGGKCVVMEWVPSRVTPGGVELSYQLVGAFKERYFNRGYQEPGQGGRWWRLADYWLNHPMRQQYEGIDLVPMGPPILPGNVLNLWRGFGVKAKAGDWSLLRQHIYEVIANGNEEFFQYVMSWMAWKVQHPGEMPEVVVALTGGKGSGKGVLGRVLMKIFGSHGLQIHSTELLTGKHNQHLQDKLFLFLDEAVWAGDTKAERILKGLTTEPFMMIEPKNVNAYPWPNRMALYMAGNDEWIVPATHDERRYAVNAVSERRKQNKEYFDPLFAEINGGGAEAFLYYLLSCPLDVFHPREEVPQTASLTAQKQFGLSGPEQWYVSLLDTGQLPGIANKNNPRRRNSSELFEHAKRFSRRNAYVTETELGRFLRAQGCEHHSNGKAQGWIFLPLDEAREAWNRKARGEWPWLVEAEDWIQTEPESLLEQGLWCYAHKQARKICGC